MAAAALALGVPHAVCVTGNVAVVGTSLGYVVCVSWKIGRAEVFGKQVMSQASSRKAADIVEVVASPGFDPHTGVVVFATAEGVVVRRQRGLLGPGDERIAFVRSQRVRLDVVVWPHVAVVSDEKASVYDVAELKRLLAVVPPAAAAATEQQQQQQQSPTQTQDPAGTAAPGTLAADASAVDQLTSSLLRVHFAMHDKRVLIAAGSELLVLAGDWQTYVVAACLCVRTRRLTARACTDTSR